MLSRRIEDLRDKLAVLSRLQEDLAQTTERDDRLHRLPRHRLPLALRRLPRDVPAHAAAQHARALVDAGRPLELKRADAEPALPSTRRPRDAGAPMRGCPLLARPR